MEASSPQWIGLEVVFGLLNLVFWGQWMWRKRTGLAAIPASPSLDVAPWGLVDLLVAVLLTFFGTFIVIRMHGGDMTPIEDRPPGERVELVWQSALGTFVGSIGIVAWLLLRRNCRDAFRAYAGDWALAFRWFVMLIVPVMLLQAFLTGVIRYESQHPIVNMVSHSPSAIWIAAFAAIVCAPVFEELTFRLLLQGWLEKLILLVRTPAGRLDAPADTGQTEADLIFAGGEARWPTQGAWAARSEPYERPVLWLPILFSSLTFAMMHIDHGPDGIPLTLLAVGLGYIFQRTRRVFPCILVHMFVNILATFVLWHMTPIKAFAP